jgi:hypothetical protein
VQSLLEARVMTPEQVNEEAEAQAQAEEEAEAQAQAEEEAEEEEAEEEEAEEEEEEIMCPICLDQIHKEENNVSKTHCGHSFHTSCLIASSRRNPFCPCCRENLINTPNRDNIPNRENVQELRRIINNLNMRILYPNSNNIIS